jgi:hypothetical protein
MPEPNRKEERVPEGRLTQVALQLKSVFLEELFPLLREIALTVMFTLVSNVGLGRPTGASTARHTEPRRLPLEKSLPLVALG